MKKYDEIKQIITERFGITSLEVYQEWLKRWRAKEWVPTEEDLAILSPDVVDSRDFWRVCEDLFSTDCVCNAVDAGSTTPFNQLVGNRNNLAIARATGMLTIIDQHRIYSIPVLELGPGYGSLKNYIEVTTNCKYVGFDVAPKIHGVKECTEHGTIPEEFIKENEGKFVISVSSNVLQHLSPNQRKAYFEASYRLLSDFGYLVFNFQAQSEGATQTQYMTLYGQFVPVPNTYELFDLLNQTGFGVVSTTRRYDGFTGVVCQKTPANAKS